VILLRTHTIDRTRPAERLAARDRGICRRLLHLSEHLDQDFFAAQAERHTLLCPSQMQHYAGAVAQPQIAGARRGQAWPAAALRIEPLEVGDVVQVEDVAIGLGVGGAAAGHPAHQLERIGPPLEGQRALPASCAGRDDFRHADGTVRRHPCDALRAALRVWKSGLSIFLPHTNSSKLLAGITPPAW
jgi:hypothetical protein